mgnify:CR=1 FL=1
MFVFQGREMEPTYCISFSGSMVIAGIFISNADMLRVNTRGLGMPGMFSFFVRVLLIFTLLEHLFGNIKNCLVHEWAGSRLLESKFAIIRVSSVFFHLTIKCVLM